MLTLARLSGLDRYFRLNGPRGISANGTCKFPFSGVLYMAQFVAFAISVFVALSIANAMGTGGAPHHSRASWHIRIFMPPPPADADPAGVSGGGPVGTSVLHAAPPPKHGT